jgi:hypothetical protein
MHAHGIQTKNSREIQVAIWVFRKYQLCPEDLEQRKNIFLRYRNENMPNIKADIKETKWTIVKCACICKDNDQREYFLSLQ